MASRGQHNIFDFVPRSELLLKCDKLVCECATVLFRNAFKSILEQNLGTVVFSLPNLELCELYEELLVEGALTEFS